MISDFVKRLIFARQFSLIDGKIEILGQKHIMLSNDAVLELQNIDQSKIYSIIKTSTLKNLELMHGKAYKALKEVSFADISEFGKKLGSSLGGVLKNIEEIYQVYGLGKLQVVDLDNDKKQAVIRVYESPIAQASLKQGRSKTNTCTINAAVLAGMFSYLFNKKIDCIETRCLAKGNSFCEFVCK